MPKYEDIANELRRELAAGLYPVGSTLPGILELKKRFAASLNTVRDGQSILRDEGLLEISQGIGAKVIGLPQPDPLALLETIKTATAQLEAILRQRN